MNPQMYSKQITVIALNSKDISPRAGGKHFTPFTVYSVTGNDGIVYETNDSVWFSKRKVGEVLNLSYSVESKKGGMGKIYSHYKINIPKPLPVSSGSNIGNNEVLSALREVYKKISESEKNIISAIEINCKGSISGPSDFSNLMPEEETPAFNNTLENTVESPVEIEEEQVETNGLPF